MNKNVIYLYAFLDKLYANFDNVYALFKGVRKLYHNRYLHTKQRLDFPQSIEYNSISELHFVKRRNICMKKKLSISIAFILCITLLVICGCSVKPVQTEPIKTSPPEPALSYSLTYYYNIEYSKANGNHVSPEIRQLLNSLGKPECITPATAVAEVYTDIPEFENNAKGTDPICILLPDLDISKYRICSWRDTETGATTSGWCRIIGGPIYGMMTDEFVSYDVDSSGIITQYKTVNLGKYDDLGLDESQFENLGNRFADAISKEIGTEIFYQYTYASPSQTTFRVFTDTQGRIVITTTIELEQDGRLLEVDLYAVVS